MKKITEFHKKEGPYEIGDWVLMNDGRIQQFAVQFKDMQQEEVAGLINREHIPEFHITVNEEDIGLSKDNFFGLVEAACPLAHQMFMQWLVVYAARIRWSNFFYTFMKFHDLPYEFQLGILIEFFHKFKMQVILDGYRGKRPTIMLLAALFTALQVDIYNTMVLHGDEVKNQETFLNLKLTLS